MKQDTNMMEEKQKFLRAQILDSGLDAQSFMNFMSTYKSEDSINLQNWTMIDLKNVVSAFKHRQQQQQVHGSNIQSDAVAQMKMRSNEVDRVMGSKLAKREKVFYDRDDLWDYQFKTNVKCREAKSYFKLDSYPEVSCKGIAVKKVGGFIFGIGGSNCIEVSFNSNFCANLVARRSEDVDWFREILVSQYPGAYVPPLKKTPQFQPEDKIAIQQRGNEIMYFLNELAQFDYLLNNKISYIFFTEDEYKKFEVLKSKNFPQNGLFKNIETMQSFSGVIPIQISQRVQNISQSSSKFSRESIQVLSSLQKNMRKLEHDLGKITSHCAAITSDFSKLSNKYLAFSEKCGFEKSEQAMGLDRKMAAVLEHFRASFNNLEMQAKKQALIINQFNDQHVQSMMTQWQEFSSLTNFHKEQLDSYLGEKLIIIKRKQRFFIEASKKQLEEREKDINFRQTSLAEKQNIYNQKHAQESKKEQENRHWQGYLNHILEKSLMALLNRQEAQIQRHIRKSYQILATILSDSLQRYEKFPEYLNGLST